LYGGVSLQINNSSVNQTINTSNQTLGTGKQSKVQVADNSITRQDSSEMFNLMPDKDLRINRKKDEIPIAEKALIDAIEKANKAIEGPNKRLVFSIHKATNEITIKVLNSDTGEVIREINPEKTLDAVARLREMAGIIVDEKR
jgi:flagellar protein FlaG